MATGMVSQEGKAVVKYLYVSPNWSGYVETGDIEILRDSHPCTTNGNAFVHTLLWYNNINFKFLGEGVAVPNPTWLKRGK